MIIERDVVLTGRDGSGNTTMDFPVTRLGNIEDTAAQKAAPAAGDYVPIMDGSDGGQMKKTPAEAFAMRGEIERLDAAMGNVAAVLDQLNGEAV